jgi:hypothetical protein
MKHIPKQGESVTMQGRKGCFVITGIDSIIKTVEVRTVADPVVFLKEIPWAVISHRRESREGYTFMPDRFLPVIDGLKKEIERLEKIAPRLKKSHPIHHEFTADLIQSLEQAIRMVEFARVRNAA